MFEWDDLRCLLAVHRTGTYAAAGAALHVNATTVGRRITALQEALGTTLLERRGRGYILNDAGLRLLEHAQRMEDEALALERAISGEDQRLSGRVRLTTTEMLATRFVAPHLHRFAQQYPDVELQIHAGTETLDLDRREADIALRLNRPQGDHLVIKRLLSIELGLYAGERYVARCGKPPPPGESYEGHELIGFARFRQFRRENDWLDENLPGVHAALRSTSVSTIYAACVGGMGIALLPRVVADAEPYLVPLHPADGLQPREVWQLVHRDLQRAARVRAVLDFLGEVLTETKRQRGGAKKRARVR